MHLSQQARRMLDEAGLNDVKILASGGLDEHAIQRLVKDGAPIDGFGVGTHLGASHGAPALDLCYKLTEYEGAGRFKNSPGKEIYPGPKQVFRIDAGRPTMHDVIAARGEQHEGKALLQPVMEGGHILDPAFAGGSAAREYVRAAVDEPLE
jgi:nicotinate phosphoribosyltransferase